jgi:hypothetical protein
MHNALGSIPSSAKKKKRKKKKKASKSLEDSEMPNTEETGSL